MFYRILADIALAVGYFAAEKHTVSFTNRCGHGIPTLVSQHGQILSTGPSYTSNGPLIDAIAYLETGKCGLNGEYCIVVGTTLENPTACVGCGSSTYISLIPPHNFTAPTGFGYQDGCYGQGAKCNNPKCITAWRKPSDPHPQITCQEKDVNLEITFC